MHCLLAVSFTCVCLRLAFICWKEPNTIKCCPFQQIKANRKQTRVKLTASKQCIRRSAFYPCRVRFKRQSLFRLSFLRKIVRTEGRISDFTTRESKKTLELLSNYLVSTKLSRILLVFEEAVNFISSL